MVRKVGLAARMAALAQIWHEITRCHDSLGLVDDRGGGDAGGGAQGLQNVMHLRLVLAIAAHALPHESHSVQAQHFSALVGEVQDDIGDGEEHVRV